MPSSLIVTANLSLSRYQWAELCVSKLLKSAPSDVVFDIGAGDGIMRRTVEDTGGDWRGFDLLPQAPEIQRWDLNDACPTKDAQCGVVLLLDVLEHLCNPWTCIKNISDVLLPNGFLVITVPNPRWSRSRLHSLVKGYPACFTEADLGNHHVFTPWQHIVEKLLSDTGFRIEDYVTLDGSTKLPRSPYGLRYPLRCSVAVLNMIIEHLDSSAHGMSYGLVARKTRIS